MFESRGGVEVLQLRAVAPGEDWRDEEEIVPELHLDPWDDYFDRVPSEAEIAALIASDPAAWPAPPVLVNSVPHSLAELLAAGESAPMTVELARALGLVDPALLDDPARVALTVGLARAESFFTARKMAAVSAFARRDPKDSFDPANDAWAELAAALRVGDRTAANLVYESRRLAHDLPGTRDALERGELTLAKARTVIEFARDLTDGQRRRLEELVLARAAGRTPKQFTAAVARAVGKIAPEALAARRRQQQEDIRLVATHHGDTMGELFASLPSEDLDTVWTGADAWARRAKADGDPRTLDALRVAALVRWAESFLLHGDSTVCDRCCDPAGATQDDPDPDPSAADSPTDAEAAAAGSGFAAPRRHGRPITVNIVIDLSTALGLTDSPGELLGSGALIPAEVVRDLIAHAEVRWLRTDPVTGRLLDISTNSYRPGARLAEFVAMRDVTATTPTGSFAPAGAQDLDHIVDHRHGGPTNPDNLHSPTRRWHIIKTKRIGWTVIANTDGTWTWTSPCGRTYTVEPFDYRLGP